MDWRQGNSKSFSILLYNKNKDFEATIGIDRNDIADDNIGIYKPVMEELANSAAVFPDTLLFKLLADSFDKKCYDGEAMISDKHTVNKNKFSNRVYGKLSESTYNEARVKMMSFKNDAGENLKIVPDLLITTPQNEAFARQLLYADIINGTTNTYKNTAELLIVPELIDYPDYWFLACTKRPFKPFIYQEREKPRLVAKTKDNDDNVFFEKQFLYGIDFRCNVGYGLWQLLIGSKGENEKISK